MHARLVTCLPSLISLLPLQVSVQYSGGRGAPSGPAWGGKEGVMDLLVTENVFYDREAQVCMLLPATAHAACLLRSCQAAGSLHDLP